MILAFALVAAVAAQGNPPPACAAPAGVTVFHTLSELPPPVRSALMTKTPDMVDSTQPFDATDVVMHGAHFHRFAFAWQRKDRTLVVTERGGIAYSNPILFFQAKGGSVSLVRQGGGSPHNLCQATDRFWAEGPQPPSLPQPHPVN